MFGQRLGRGRVAVVAALVVVVGLSTMPAMAELPTGAASLSGVISAGGSPVSGASVSLCTSDLASCDYGVTVTGGSYAFTSLADGTYTLSVIPPDGSPYLVRVTDVTVTVSGATVQNQSLPIGGRLSLAVALPNGAGPATGQIVSVCRTSPPGTDACPTIAWNGTTDGAGLVTTTALPVGAYSISAGYSGPTWYPRTVTATVTESTTATVPTITLLAPASLSGYVRDANGTPIAGASVSVAAPGLPSYTKVVDASGYYSIPSAQPGTYGGTAVPPWGSVLGQAPFVDLVLGEGATVSRDFVLSRRAAIYASSSVAVGSPTSGSVWACLAPGEPRLTYNGLWSSTDCGDGSTGRALSFTFGHIELAGGQYNVGNAYVVNGAVVTSPVVGVTIGSGQAVTCSFVAGAPGVRQASCGTAVDGSWVYATVTDDQGVPFASNAAAGVCNGTFVDTGDPSAWCAGGSVSTFAGADAVGRAAIGPLPPGSFGVRGTHTVLSPQLATVWNTAASVKLRRGGDQTCTLVVPGSTACVAGTPIWAGEPPVVLTIAGTVTGDLGTLTTVAGCLGAVDPDPDWSGSGNPCGGGTVTSATANLATGAFVLGNGITSLAAGTYHLRAYALVDGIRIAGNALTVTLATSSLTGVSLTFPPPNVATVTPTNGTDPVTIASPDGSTLSNVTVAPPPEDFPNADTSFPAGVLSFSLKLAPGETSADVTLTMPAGSAPDAYWKLVGGVWTAVPMSGTGSSVAFAGDSVTLHLVDNDMFDTNSTVGVIGDPGGPSHSFKFTSFRAPIVLPKTTVKAGSMLPIKWRVTNLLAVPSSDPVSFTSLTVTAPAASCGAGASSTLADSASALRYNGAGEWEFDWKSAKSAAGKCSTVALQLADGAPAHAIEVKFTK